MELGNLVFGHSRGNYKVPRTAQWQAEVQRLFEALPDPHGYDSYGREFVNEVFEVHPYWWGDCECGYEAKEAGWDASHQHSGGCYQTLAKARLRGKPYDSYDQQREWEQKVYKDLCKQFGIPWRNGAGCAVHCTCNYQKEWEEWANQNSHEPTCGMVRPNFWYKPTGFELRWYKYPLRDSYMSHQLTLKEFRQIIDDCLRSVDTQG